MPELDRGEAQEAAEETWFERAWRSTRFVPTAMPARDCTHSRSVRLPLALPARVQFDAEPTIDAFAQATVSAADELFARFQWSGRGGGDRARHPAGDARLNFLNEAWL